MPSISKNETIIEKVTTQNGEITINLNLKITVENGLVNVQASAIVPASQESVSQDQKIDEAMFIPDEKFDFDIPIVENFGKKQ